MGRQHLPFRCIPVWTRRLVGHLLLGYYIAHFVVALVWHARYRQAHIQRPQHRG